MTATSDALSRTVVAMVFGGLAIAGGMLAWAQVSEPQAAPQRRATILPGQQNPAATNQPTDPAAQQRGQNRPAAAEAQQPTNRATQPMTPPGQRQRSSATTSSQQDAAWLGIFLNENRDDAERGATVAHVYPAGPAARAGLQSGDVIQQVNGKQIATSQELITALEEFQPGDKAELSLLRNNAPTKLNVMLGSRNSFGFNDRSQGPWGSRGGEYDESDEYSNIPQYAMELEHNRRNAEQHQRIENEIAQLREEIRLLREALQRR